MKLLLTLILLSEPLLCRVICVEKQKDGYVYTVVTQNNDTGKVLTNIKVDTGYVFKLNK